VTYRPTSYLLSGTEFVKFSHIAFDVSLLVCRCFFANNNHLICSLHILCCGCTVLRVGHIQVEIKLKKLEGWRWEKLEGDGSENAVKQFNPGKSQSVLCKQ